MADKPEDKVKTAAEKNPAANKPKAKKKAGEMSTPVKVLVAVFAVLMAASMMLPSLSAIYSVLTADAASSSSSSSTSSDTSSDASSDTSSDSSSDSSESSESSDSADTAEDTTDSDAEYASTDETYKSAVASLEEKYAADKTNLATLLNLGQKYMTWGVSVTYVATTDASTSHANELLEKARAYYAEYLAIKDSNAVKVDRALCKYYEEDTTAATAELEALTAEAPDYGPAWANLGVLYEAASRTDDAKAAYNKAIETDASDEYGAKSYAETRISSIESAASSSTTSTSTDLTDASSDGTTTSSTSSSSGLSGLSQTLSSISGTGF